MKQFTRIVPVLSVAGLIIVSLPVSGLNFIGPDQLPYLYNVKGELLLPVLSHGEGELLIAVEFYDTQSGIHLKMPLVNLGKECFVITSKDGRLYIDLLSDGERMSTDSKVLLETSESEEYPGVYLLDTDPDHIANGLLIILPLENYPKGTGGYVIHLLKNPDDGGYLIPLIEMPRGHLHNHHSETNEWGIQYDLGIPLDYTVLRP